MVNFLAKERAPIFAGVVSTGSASLFRLIRFIDCTKILMARSGSKRSLRCFSYSGHKRIFLIYQARTTPDGVMLVLYSSEAYRKYNGTL